MLKRLLIVCGLCFLSACVVPALAQNSKNEELFLPAEIPAGMSPPARLMQQVYRPIRINKTLLDTARPGQIVSLRLFNETPLALKLERQEVHIPGTYSWVGRLTGEIESLFIISIVKDAASLYLNVGGTNEIGLQYLRDGVHLLYTAPLQQGFRCGTGPTTVRLPDPGPASGIKIQATATIETSICVSNQAVSELGSFNAAVSKGINCVVYTNNACNNSNSQIQFNLYAVYQISFDESGTRSQIFNRFSNSDVAAFLLARGALDVVGLLISNFPQGDAAGVGSNPGSYTVSQVDFFTERTYAHEVGHNVGNGHEPGDAYPNDPDQDRGVYHYSAGFSAYYVGQYYLSIMSYGKSWNSFSIRNFMPHYSNPSVNYYSSPGIGGVTGVANDRDNARSMRDYGSVVAAYASVGSDIYVDSTTPYGANGSQLYPYRTVINGMNAVPNNGTLWVRGPQNYNERPVTGKPMFVRNWDGVVNIGRP